MELLLRRCGTLVDVSPDGYSPLPYDLIRLLSPHLSYQHKRLLRGQEAFDYATGERHAIDIENRALYAVEQGRLATGYGFMHLIVRVLTQAGHQVRYVDISPPRERPDCYTPDWESVHRMFAFRPRQVECLENIERYEGGVINAAPGFGKAQPLDEPVITPNGPSTIGALKVGDLVIGGDGQPTVVRGVYPQGVKDIVAVEFTDGEIVRCCREHLWAVRPKWDKRRGKDYRVLPISEIESQVLMPSGDVKWFVPVAGPVAFSARKVPLDPYLIGVLLGDGALGQGSRFSNIDQQLIARVGDTVSPLGLYTRHIKGPDWIITHGVKRKRNPVTQVLRSLGLFGLKSKDKFIPDVYKYNTPHVRLEVLRGLMDTDGHVRPKGYHVEFGHVASKRLAYDVCEVARSLGGVAKVGKKVQDGTTYYRVGVNLSVNPFWMSRKSELWREYTKQGKTKGIKAVRPAGTAECACISVAAPDGRYLTTGYTVTHNTHLFDVLPILFPRAKFHIVVKPKDVAARIVRRMSRNIPLVGQVGGGKRTTGRVTVYTADSLHLSDGDCDFLLCDEAHQLMAESYSAELGRAYRISRNYAFSGTPYARMDGAAARLQMFFGPDIFTLTYPQAVELGLTVPIRVRWLDINLDHNPAKDKVGTVRDRWGVWRNHERNTAIAQDVRQYDANTQVLILCATFDHAAHLWNQLPEFELCYAGKEAEDIEGYQRARLLPSNFIQMSSHRRDMLRAAFEAGTLKKVIATDVWSTGVDFESLQVLYRADARESEALATQGPTRVSRIFAGKAYGEVIDCFDRWDRSFRRKSEVRRRYYVANGWEQVDWPLSRGRRQVSRA